MAAAGEARRVQLPCWLKASFSTAGRGVRYVTSPGQAARAYDDLAAAGPVLAQQPVAGTYAQVAGLFAHDRLVAVHTSEQAGTGAGGSAAARVNVDHPQPRAHIEQLGRHLGWHGGLTLDYLHHNGTPQYIEANPRTVEPGNAAAAGVNLPALTIAIGRGDSLPAAPVRGRPGVHTHSSLALAYPADRPVTRREAIQAIYQQMADAGGEVRCRGTAAHRPVRRPGADIDPLGRQHRRASPGTAPPARRLVAADHGPARGAQP